MKEPKPRVVTIELIPEAVGRSLARCEEKLKHLAPENKYLREPSDTFGQLAERLSKLLQRQQHWFQSHEKD